jgi:ubiquinone/menaquinone biosynthesis C-methylase UbiE
MSLIEVIRDGARRALGATRDPSRRASIEWSGYQHPVVDLGDSGDERVRGIHSAISDQSIVREYIQPQFLEEAEAYARKFDDRNHHHYRYLLEQAFQRIGLKERARVGLRVLDIGSGSGCTIFPLLELCPRARIIGSDLSVEMLIQFQQALIHRGWGGVCALLQLNAEELDFRPRAFDLVVGFAILHHLFAPDRTIAGCASILKRGGHAVFFEPFAEGHTALRDRYDEILQHPRQDELSAEVRELLVGLIREADRRRDPDKSAPYYRQMDDKWVFHQAYFQDLARTHGFSECRIEPLHDTQGHLRRHTELLLRLAIRREPDALPEWAWRVIQKFEDSLSASEARNLIIEGCVMLRR